MTCAIFMTCSVHQFLSPSSYENFHHSTHVIMSEISSIKYGRIDILDTHVFNYHVLTYFELEGYFSLHLHSSFPLAIIENANYSLHMWLYLGIYLFHILIMLCFIHIPIDWFPQGIFRIISLP